MTVRLENEVAKGLLDWILIPAGAFQLGEGGEAHLVELPDFFIGRYPVTARQYYDFIEDTGRPPPAHWPDGQPYPLFANHPVVNVSWFDALAYCGWLGNREGRPYRLPTEVEWEKAARGPERFVYPWGDIFDEEKCHNWAAGAGFTSPVDTHPVGASPYGVMDMAGNVWEWCSTIYRDYPYSAQDGREDMTDPQGWRTLRGGSWLDTGWGVRAARRLSGRPDHASQNTGFRLACDA